MVGFEGGSRAPSLTPKFAQGESASGTAGTVVAEIEAGGTNALVGLAVALFGAGANTDLQVVLTFDDDTTETLTGFTSATAWAGGRAGCTRVDGGTPADNLAFADQAKAVRKVSVQTAGTGTGNRAAVLSALSV